MGEDRPAQHDMKKKKKMMMTMMMIMMTPVCGGKGLTSGLNHKPAVHGKRAGGRAGGCEVGHSIVTVK